CGKSTVGRLAAGLLRPSAGQVIRARPPGTQTGPHDDRSPRLKVQLVFQNPTDSLNPRHRVRRIIAEPAIAHRLISPDRADDYVDQLMASVGLDPDLKMRRSHELSGGQCQRVGIARALSVQPDVLVCDEPISALDVSVQAQVLNLFLELKETRSLAYLFISHDLTVVERISDRVAVMYLGRIVEISDAVGLFARPNHPYTRALLESAPRIDQRHRKFNSIKGEVASPITPPAGCHFHPRCPHAWRRCTEERPALRQVASGHWSACHLNDAG
ncbi:MAG: ATP-binding cassette domain-containing protein, partial [Proteobacteria bacterium]|nr:ATP-binding cassette domain-containing protein [Pseudomonadota bacterium]